MSDHANDESEIRAAFAAGKLELAASGALRLYRHEILSFIGSRLHNRADAEETLSIFAENLWTGLPNFQWRCTLRTWCYTLAHNAVRRFATSAQRRPARNLRLSCPGVLSELVEQMRSATYPYQRTDVKDRFRALREQLDEEDQMLLVLRVDRNLSFREIALTCLGDVDSDDAVIAREEARLRKAFTRLRPELRRLAEAEGLLPPKGEAVSGARAKEDLNS
ncbi:MAG: hypothetical protein RL701_1941 [Pseudomonadota bacterium]